MGDDFSSVSIEENGGGKFEIRNLKFETGGEMHETNRGVKYKVLNLKSET